MTTVIGAFLWFWRGAEVPGLLGDTDDALRLVLVRDLISGRAGWWDQHLVRLQPPLGMDLHWSRLVDGGIVGVEWLFRLFMDPVHAEIAARTAWPFLWILPPTAAALVIARRMKGDLGALLCAVLMLVNVTLYAQWIPGRIDHHNVQIALCMVALAGAIRGGRGGLLAAGAATGLGLAVGVEGLLFEAIIGAAVALRFLLDPAAHRGPTRAYAAALLATLSSLFLIQTPPSRWGVAVCDALGVNLTAGVAVACLGLLALTAVKPQASFRVRLGALLAVGVAAGVVYAALEPKCLHGPLGQADPRLWPVWLSQITEMRSLYRGVGRLDAYAIDQLACRVVAVLGWLWLGRRPENRSFAWTLLAILFVAGVIAEAQAQRMSFYTAWFSTPVMAAAVAELGERFLKGRLPLTVALAVALSPTWVTGALASTTKGKAEPAKTGQADDICSQPATFRRLSTLPPGVVLGEVDLGPYVLMMTPHSVVAAPYHRMAWGILSADAALAAPPGPDEAKVRSLHVDYVVDCPSHRDYGRRHELRPVSLQSRLDAGLAPGWLREISSPGDALRVYRVISPK